MFETQEKESDTAVSFQTVFSLFLVSPFGSYRISNSGFLKKKKKREEKFETAERTVCSLCSQARRVDVSGGLERWMGSEDSWLYIGSFFFFRKKKAFVRSEMAPKASPIHQEVHNGMKQFDFSGGLCTNVVATPTNHRNLCIVAPTS